MSQLQNQKALSTERVLAAKPERVLEAFEQADQLATWWGPAGFTNTFEVFEFKPGGRWVHTMHGPNGVDYPNESIFRQTGPETIVIDHVVDPLFVLTVTLTPRGEETHLTWEQDFATLEVADKVRSIVKYSNEQVLDRLEALVTGDPA